MATSPYTPYNGAAYNPYTDPSNPLYQGNPADQLQGLSAPIEQQQPDAGPPAPTGFSSYGVAQAPSYSGSASSSGPQPIIEPGGPTGPTGLLGVNNPVYGNPVAAPQFNAADNQNIASMVGENEGYENSQGQAIQQEAEGQLGYYGALQPQYTSNEDAALAQLNAQPGYTPGETSQINADYSQFNSTPQQIQAELGDPNAPAQVANQGAASEGAQLNAYEQNLSGEVGNFANYTGSAVQGLDTGLGTATSALGTGLEGANQQLDTGLTSAQSEFGALNTAVQNPALAFDPNSTEKQITDAQVAQMGTNAGTTVGNQYRSAEDQLQRNAAAAGNTSPLAEAAANARLQTQSAGADAQAVSNAQIAALQAQEQQATSIEQQREGAAQTQTGFQANAATTEEAAAQQAALAAGQTGVASQEFAGQEGLTAATTAGTQGIAAGEAEGAADINAANTYGQTAIGTQETMTGQQYGAAQTAEAAEAAREAAVTNQQYAQGTGSQQLTSAGAQAVGNTAIAGQAAYRAGMAGQQAYAQQGGQAAVGQQQAAYGTETSGLSSGANTSATYRNGQPSVIGDLTGVLGAVGSAASGIAKLGGGSGASSGSSGGSAEGNIFTEPTVQRIGERGPEIILPLGGYRSSERRKQAA